MATVMITGGTGLIGKALTALLIEKGYKVIIVTRNPKSKTKHATTNIQYAKWDVKKQTIDAVAIAGVDHIVHLAGAGVADKRWTTKRKKEIAESRTSSSGLLVKALEEIPNKVKTVVSASAVGWYGPDPQIPNPRPFIESDPPDAGFLGETCRQWEQSIEPVILLKKRLVVLRTGIVFANNGGAFKEFKRPVDLGIAAILGNGKQIISWIHIVDLCRIYMGAIEDESIHGHYNAVSPGHGSNKELMLELAKGVKGNFFLSMSVPRWALKLALGEMSEEVLKSATVSCEKIRNTGFTFIYPSLKSAISDLLQKPSAAGNPQTR